MGPNTYTVTYGGGIGSPSHVSVGPARAKVMKAANQFCNERGFVMLPLAIRERPGAIGSHTAEVSLDFRAVPPGDAEIRRPNMESVAPVQRIHITQ